MTNKFEFVLAGFLGGLSIMHYILATLGKYDLGYALLIACIMLNILIIFKKYAKI